MSTPQASSAPLVPETLECIPSHLSPGWIHVITILMCHPLTSEPGKCIWKWFLYQDILDYTDLVITWDHIQFEDNRHLQENEEPDGSITYLKTNTVEQLFRQDRPADQKHNAFYFIFGEQWSNLTVHDMRTALVNAGLENHRFQATPGTPMSNFTSPSSSTSMRPPSNWEFASFKQGI